MIPGSVQGDVYSFGVMLLELDQRSEPFTESELSPKGEWELSGCVSRISQVLFWEWYFSHNCYICNVSSLAEGQPKVKDWAMYMVFEKYIYYFDLNERAPDRAQYWLFIQISESIARLCAFQSGTPFRPTISQETSEQLAELVDRCWDENPYNRPTVSQIVKEIRKLNDGR